MTGRGLRGRRVARSMLLAVLALDAVLAFLATAAPTTMGGAMLFDPPAHLGSLIAAIGVALHVGGFAWMIRIYRAQPDAHRSSWRWARS